MDKYTLLGIMKLVKLTLLSIVVSGYVALCFHFPELTLIPLLVMMGMLGRTIILDEAEKQRTLDQLNQRQG